MGLFSFQILLVNFIIAAIITSVIYFFNKKVRFLNPLLLFIVSSLGSFIGTLCALFLPSFTLSTDSILLKNLVLSVPGVLVSILFLYLWIKGNKTEGYF